MTSITFTRPGLRFAVAALVTSIAVAAQPMASADPVKYDPNAFTTCADQVVKDTANGTKPKNDYTFLILKCCQDNGGVPTQNGNTSNCQAPAQMSDPGTSGPPTKPRTQQNPGSPPAMQG
jgi:hypothetical protein